MKKDIHNGWFSLIDIYGTEYIDKLDFSTKNCEDICMKLFYNIQRPTSFNSNRGDFVIDDSKYYDQKRCEVKYYLPNHQNGIFFHTTYSNILSKLWINIAMDELKLIYNDYINDFYDDKWNRQNLFKLKTIYYKKEMTFNDICFIDEYIISGIKNPTSFCGKNKIPFLHFLNYLCRHNVKRFANLIVFHEPINQKQMHKFDLMPDGSFKTYKNPKKYIVTPVDILQTKVYVDYIGYNGFKCYIEPLDDYQNMYIPDNIIPYIREIDDAFDTLLKINQYKSDKKLFENIGPIFDLDENIKLYEQNQVEEFYDKPIYS